MLPKRKWLKILIIFLILFILLYAIGMKDEGIIIKNKDIKELIRETECIKAQNTSTGITYYVSQDGTSIDGTDINNPMSFEIANGKKYYGGDKVLLKRGDTFYGLLNFEVDANENNLFYVGSYGDESLEKPRISGAAVLSNTNAWIYEDGLYKLDMSSKKDFIGISNELKGEYNVGSFIDEHGEIHGNRKKNKELLKDNFDFYCEDRYLYLKCDSNPSDILGKIAITFQNRLVNVSSNMILDGIIIENTGVHGISKKQHPIENVCIMNCVIQNIGGSYTSNGGRYGNGIEFWHQSKNTLVQNCIIRNVYDAGYTCQGNSVSDGFYNNYCENNIFINCTYAFEFFCHNNYTYDNIHFSDTKVENNIVINQGKGWGFESRDDKWQPADLVIWQIVNEENGLTYRNNRLYNSRALYYKYPTVPIETYKSLLNSDDNIYYNNENTMTYISDKSYNDITKLDEFGIDTNSSFYNLSDSEIEEISNEEILNSNDYDEIKAYYDNFDIKYRNNHWVQDTTSSIDEIMNEEEYNNLLENSTINASYTELKNAISKLSENVDTVSQDSVSYSYECLYNFISTIVNEYNNNSISIEENILLELIEKLDNIADKYKEIYSYYITEDSIELDTVKNDLNNTIDKYNNNLDLDIGSLENIIIKIRDLYNNSITTDNVYENVLNKNRIIYITNIVNSIIDSKINDFVAEEKGKIQVEFDRDIYEPTNENITVTLITGDSTKITNNEGSNKHTFYENGKFTFELDIKGVQFSVEVTIANINKDYTIEDGYISNISNNTLANTLKDELNLNNYTILHNGEELDLSKDIISTGDILKYDNKEYTLIVSGDVDKDGNCGIRDLVSLRKCLLDYTKYDTIEEMAADTNQDDNLDIKDLVGMRKIILN